MTRISCPVRSHHRPFAWPALLAFAGLFVAGASQAQDAAPDTATEATPESTAEATTPATTTSTPGHTTAEDIEGLFIDQIQVNVVNIDVYVTDKDGNPVLDLTRDDFEIYENKQEMPITNFSVIKDGLPYRDGKVLTAALEEDPSIPEALRKLEVPEDQRLNLIIFIDNFNIAPINRNRVMREIKQFLLKNTRREDRVMLMTYNRTLKVVQPFTSDPRLINAALSGLEKHTGQAGFAASERREILEVIDEYKEDEFAATQQARHYADGVFNDLSFTIGALKQFIEQLAGLPGRKAVLHVSDGIPMVAGEEVFHYVGSLFRRSSALTEMFSYDTSRRFRELTAAANANRVSFYTVDAGGLRTYSYIDASNPGGSDGPRGAFIDQINISNRQNTLHYMANQTGGKAIVNRNRVFPALDAIGKEWRNYYYLGFSPPHSGDGRLYNVEVKTKRKGLKVSHRANYRDKTVETRMSDGTLAALNFGFETNPMEVALEFGRATKREDGRHYLVPIRVQIPLGKVTLVPRNMVAQGRLRLFIAALDEEGGTSPVQEAPVPIEIPLADLEAARQQKYVYSIELLMRSGGQRVAVGVRDDLGTETSFVTRTLRVGAS